MKVHLHRLRKSILLFSLFLLGIVVIPGKADASPVILSNESKISILTCDPGDQLYSLFGHTAIRVEDPSLRIDIVYNYGTFDFTTDGFYLKFARGLLPYQLARGHFHAFLDGYKEERRSVYSQTLLLDSIQRQRLWDLLEENYLPENRTYLYNFLYDNCTTRARDILSTCLNGEITWTARGQGKSFWNLLDEYLAVAPWTQWGIHTLLGSPAIAEANHWEQMFLPDYLMHGLEGAFYQQKPLVLPTETLYQETESFYVTPWYLSPLVVFAIGVAVLICLLQRFRSRKLLKGAAIPFFLITGGIGCLLIFLGYFTQHPTTAPNFNLVWANPLNLIAVFFLGRKKYPALIRGYLYLYLCLLAAGFFLWFLFTPAVLYSSMLIVVWMFYLTSRLRQ